MFVFHRFSLMADVSASLNKWLINILVEAKELLLIINLLTFL